MGRKHCGKREKLLNFSFFHSVFKGIVLQTSKNHGLFGKGLKKTTQNHFPPHFFKGGYLDFTELKNIYYTEIYMEKKTIPIIKN